MKLREIRELVDLHRRLVAIPSPSHEEEAVAACSAEWLDRPGIRVERLGRNVVAFAGEGTPLLLNSHLDTVPPTSAWTRDPFDAVEEEGRLHGLGSNDAKASVAAMMMALRKVAEEPRGVLAGLMLVVEEETGGAGTELAWPALRERGFHPRGVVVGEPTGLQVCTAQKGLLVLKLRARGKSLHAAHGRALGAVNAVRALARALVALDEVDLGGEDPLLGGTTLEPTIITGGQARNMLPEEAVVHLDLRTNGVLDHDEVVERIRAAVDVEVEVVSKRLRSVRSDGGADIVQAACEAAPGGLRTGSSTMSDMVFFEDVPVVKCGPGQTRRSHTADEFVLRDELLAGYRFYCEMMEVLGGM